MHAKRASGRKVAIVTCSTRSPRLNPYISQHIWELASPCLSDFEVEIVDLNDQSLPLFDESVIPGHLPAHNPTPGYSKEHTRKWSATVRKYDAFIFVTPQYNWSVPASLKNALDYLFHEWTGKPAVIVTYGGHGGSKASGHLKQILQGLRMLVVSCAPQLETHTTTLDHCLKQGQLSADDIARWETAGLPAQLQIAVAELQENLET